MITIQEAIKLKSSRRMPKTEEELAERIKEIAQAGGSIASFTFKDSKTATVLTQKLDQWGFKTAQYSSEVDVYWDSGDEL